MNYVETLRDQHRQRRALWRSRAVPDNGINLRPVIASDPDPAYPQPEEDYTPPPEPRIAPRPITIHSTLKDRLSMIIFHCLEATDPGGVLTKADVLSATKIGCLPVVRARYAFLASHILRISKSRIAREINKDHSTVCVVVKNLEKVCRLNPDIAYAMAQLELQVCKALEVR